MPLRSVEAATRDDAIAAAREQFGPHARVVGVRRVRSGGVLGFFATERYVAEVAPDQFVRPGVPPSAGPVPTAGVEAYDSPLASAVPARARTTAPARNGAAAWAAEAARAGSPETPSGTAHRAPAPELSVRPVGDDVQRHARLDDRLDELTGLLGGAPAAARATFRAAAREPATAAPRLRTTPAPAEKPATASQDDALAPSPFTAALARMVSGDREVRQAVAEALEQPASEPAPAIVAYEATGTPAPHPGLAAAIRSADPSSRSEVAHQEDPTARDQATAPASTSATALPACMASEQPVDPSPSTRQEEIAEALRAALAQGHSDEAITGILRKILAGDSPQEAIAEPAVIAPSLSEPSSPVEIVEPGAVEPAAPLFPESVAAPVAEAVVATELPASASSSPLFGAPAPRATVSDLGWGASAATTLLWGEPTADVEDRLPPVTAEAPVAPAVDDEPVAEESAVAAEEPEEVAEEAVAAEVAAAGIVESAEVAPMLARTASDPAPLPMSLDATTVLPRVSLLPPLPGARGRGLPPVPPSSSRPAVPSTRPGTPSAPEVAPAPEVTAPAPRALATVTRLPVAPLMANDDLPVMPELDDADEALAPVEAPAAAAPRAAPAPAAPDEVVTRLAGLGLPRELLGEDFTDRVEADGTYAALTHALAVRLPEVPEPPSGAGDVLFVVGPGVETLRAARTLAASLRLDPYRVQWATRGDLAGLASQGSRMTTTDAAIDRRQEAAHAGTVTIVAVDAPLRSDAHWMGQMLDVWSPVAVWAVVEATRKPEDLELWLDGLARVDALVVQDTDLSADPAAVLQRLTVPVALLDGARATPHRWASLLCERLDGPQA
ncbi:hypothetical protein ABC795_03225 [Blastococcus sp. HT6-30]|uniref:hypothetical protein n=1 Tax=Blastococcus sp. HT6-30 TaxID=3144843 RepID=UPI00321BE7E5